ncbi:cysteine proteinase [Eremomyces bilateralis CBS 781.70]|uniref:Cysteine proteinase n=1 Tax=Eremomyces bilateralis CBS 781.70 TaxID=1392243 RepID=A0A6G1FUZ5_9PEZI|nr:cysteine proteinase [Eremomyces bilateralis CBS 781.70]KAF1809637.1 cysteine proteinase [Eremomyces bilateralis CBS 781.70]
MRKMFNHEPAEEHISRDNIDELEAKEARRSPSPDSERGQLGGRGAHEEEIAGQGNRKLAHSLRSRPRESTEYSRYFGSRRKLTPDDMPDEPLVNDTPVRRSTRRAPAIRYEIDEPPAKVAPGWWEVHGPPKWSSPVVYPETGKRRAQVAIEDLQRLDPEEFLNDSLIDFYMLYLRLQSEEKGLREQSIYVFNALFYTALTKVSPGQRGVNYSAVQRWTAKENLFNYEYVVIPINENSHWYLAIIYNLPALLKQASPEREEPAVPIVDEEALGKRGLSTRVAVTQPPTLHRVDYVDGPAASIGNTQEEDSSYPVERDQPGREESSQPTTKVTESQEQERQQSGPTQRSPASARKSKKKGPQPRKMNPDHAYIILLDSMGVTSRPKTTRNIKDYLHHEADAKLGIDLDDQRLQGINAKQLPRQDNWYDCGAFLLFYFSLFMKEPRAYVTKIITNETDLPKWWFKIDADQMRNTIRDIVLEIGDLQEARRKEVKLLKKAGKMCSLNQDGEKGCHADQPSSPKNPLQGGGATDRSSPPKEPPPPLEPAHHSCQHPNEIPTAHSNSAHDTQNLSLDHGPPIEKHSPPLHHAADQESPDKSFVPETSPEELEHDDHPDLTMQPQIPRLPSLVAATSPSAGVHDLSTGENGVPVRIHDSSEPRIRNTGSVKLANDAVIKEASPPPLASPGLANLMGTDPQGPASNENHDTEMMDWLGIGTEQQSQGAPGPADVLEPMSLDGKDEDTEMVDQDESTVDLLPYDGSINGAPVV